MSNNFKTIKFKKELPIAWIILNRPHKYNAINSIMMQELSDSIDMIKKDHNIRCLIITGKGKKAFSTGADLKELKKLKSKNVEVFSRKGQQVFSKIEKLSIPVIVAINGYTLGGGLELVLACDFKIASSNSEFGFPEIKIGLIPAWGGTQKLPLIIGFSNAKRLILTGNRIKANEALKIGLIDKIAPMEKLETETITLAKKLCNNPSNAIKQSKLAINHNRNPLFEKGLKKETKIFRMLFNQKEVKERITAFSSMKNKKRKIETHDNKLVG